jgi:hypothetical protein
MFQTCMILLLPSFCAPGRKYDRHQKRESRRKTHEQVCLECSLFDRTSRSTSLAHYNLLTPIRRFTVKEFEVRTLSVYKYKFCRRLDISKYQKSVLLFCRRSLKTTPLSTPQQQYATDTTIV